MKTFKQFNENITDYLQPKSEEEINVAFNNLSDNEKIQYIIQYQLDYDLLPRNEEGICIYEGNLECSSNQLTELPDNLTINGGLFCNANLLTELPYNLNVNGSLYCNWNKLIKLPDNLTIYGDLNCSINQLTELPKNLKVKGDLWCIKNKVKLELPKDAIIGGKFYN